jgi:hypothetical protein
MEAPNIVICGKGLDKNGRVHFNLTRSSLIKGEALHVFNDKTMEQEEEMKDTHIKCLHAITEHIFPKDMQNHMFLHLKDRQASKQVSCQVGQNQQLAQQTLAISTQSTLSHWQSYLQCEDKFNITASSSNDFVT